MSLDALMITATTNKAIKILKSNPCCICEYRFGNSCVVGYINHGACPIYKQLQTRFKTIIEISLPTEIFTQKDINEMAERFRVAILNKLKELGHKVHIKVDKADMVGSSGNTCRQIMFTYSVNDKFEYYLNDLCAYLMFSNGDEYWKSHRFKCNVDWVADQIIADLTRSN